MSDVSDATSKLDSFFNYHIVFLIFNYQTSTIHQLQKSLWTNVEGPKILDSVVSW